MKKASANMWWIIIGAVIALIVMIVLLVMFTGKSGTLEKGILDCESKGGTCMDKGMEQTTCKDKGGTVSSAFTCTKENDKERFCCFEGQ